MEGEKCKMQRSACIIILSGASGLFKELGTFCSLHFKFYTLILLVCHFA